MQRRMVIAIVWMCLVVVGACASSSTAQKSHPTPGAESVDDLDAVVTMEFSESEVEPVVAELSAEQLRTTPDFEPGIQDVPPKLEGPGAVDKANSRSTVAPREQEYLEATQVYDFIPGVIYEVYAAPGRITSLLLEPGETIEGLAAGDTIRWMQGESRSAGRTVLWIKPLRSNLETNLVITTDRRMYQVALKSYESTYMASVVWAYPTTLKVGGRGGAGSGRKAGAPKAAEPVVYQKKVHNAAYHLVVEDADRPPVWRPTFVFDDGWRTYFEFDERVLERATPVIWVLARNGEPELVNSRRVNNRLVVDRVGRVFRLALGEEDDERMYVEANL